MDLEAENEIDHELLSEAETAWAQREWSIQHVLFPSMRLFLKPPTAMATNGAFVQVCVECPTNIALGFSDKSYDGSFLMDVLYVLLFSWLYLVSNQNVTSKVASWPHKYGLFSKEILYHLYPMTSVTVLHSFLGLVCQ